MDELDGMDEITVEYATDLGLLPDPLDAAYRAVEGCSILSKATDRAFESAYRSAREQIFRDYGVDREKLTITLPRRQIYEAAKMRMEATKRRMR